MKKITNDEIKVFSAYIYEISGIVLDKSKGYLIETRLRPLVVETKSASYSELLFKVKSDSTEKLQHQIVDAISTNETFFFRDNKPFELLRNKILPDLIDRRRLQYKSGPVPLRIWSAACSSGQELYSIAMTLKEMLPDMNAYNFHIFGSDISDKIIAQASYGKYSRFEVERGLPKQYLHRYFNQIGSEWRIKDEIRAMAQFSKTNLLKPFPEIGKFDIIFCRNVAIYFSQADRQKLFRNIANVLVPDGALLLGGSESMSGVNTSFESRNYLRAIYFQKKGWENSTVTPATPASTTPIARKAVPRRIPVVIPTKPKPARPKRVATRPKPAVVTRPSVPKVAVVEKHSEEVRVAEHVVPIPQVTPSPEPKQSLLSAIQEKKQTDKSRLSERLKEPSSTKNKEPKRSLLDKVNSRAQEKREKLQEERDKLKGDS